MKLNLKRKVWRVPISFKLISIFVLFLSVATIFFAQRASTLFAKVLTQREEYSNLSEASGRAQLVEQKLTGLAERAVQLAQRAYSAGSPVPASLATTGSLGGSADEGAGPNSTLALFERERDLLRLELMSKTSTSVESLFVWTRPPSPDAKTDNSQESEFWKALRTQQNLNLQNAFQRNFEIRNGSFKERGVLTLVVPAVRDASGAVSHVAIADFELSSLQKLFAEESERSLFLVDDQGLLLAHPQEAWVLEQRSLAQKSLVAQALADTQPRRQVQIKDPESGLEFVGAYVKIPSLKMVVLAETRKDLILEPARHVERQAYYIAGVVISIAIFLIFMFSMTLTGPLEILVALVRRVAHGDFEIQASQKIKSVLEDEVHELAHAIDSMTEGLKERDKVKSLFSKFHGSSVAEDLLQKDITVGGQNKEVTVFFSDIRGFTAFSEKRTPEEVVSMLNEYFEVMVGIINRNNGVVDKFIGDAIMAVWGAPRESDKDTHNAVRSCLEMRKSLLDLNQKRKERGQEPIMIGMGLHTGRAISGTIGSHERMEYTVIGDTVNMTSRIESSTKSFGTDLLVSQSVMERVQDQFIWEVAGQAIVKGKSEPLTLYYVKGWIDEQGQPVLIETPYSSFDREADEKTKVA